MCKWVFSDASERFFCFCFFFDIFIYVEPSIFFNADLDRIVEPLRSTVQSKVKANSVKQEYEKQDELKRSALRAISALCTIPDASKYRIYAQNSVIKWG